MSREFYEKLIINDSSSCSSLTSGALQVRGGIACAENIYLKGCVNINNVCIKLPDGVTPYDFILPKTDGNNGEILCSSGKNGMVWVKPTGTGNIVLSNNSILGGNTTLGKTNIPVGTTSSDIYTGALTVVGGISTQENLNVGGYIGITNNNSITRIKSSSKNTYNFILPTVAGLNGEVLTSGGGNDTPMRWTCMKDFFHKPPTLGKIIPNNGFLTSLSIGTSSQVYPLTIASKENDFISFMHGVTRVGTISTNGYSTSYNTTSDYRLKDNVKKYDSGIEKIMNLKPVSFNYINDLKNVVGFLAHELQKEIPEAVIGEKDATFETGEIKPQMVDYGRLTPYIVSCLQGIIKELANINQKFQS